jgi:hypothetical protein
MEKNLENNKTKICTKCGKELNLNNFQKEKSGKYGFASQCKICKKIYANEYRAKNRDKINEKSRIYSIKNKEKNKEYNKKYKKKYYEDNKEEIKEKRKVYYKNNKDKFIAYYNENKKRIDYNHFIYKKNRYNTDMSYRILHNSRNRINKVLNGNSKSKTTENLLGCSVEYFKKHLESLFTPGMTWENYGYHGWHIDHILPCSAFELKNSEEQEICFHYTNMQPLWKNDNLIKKDKII